MPPTILNSEGKEVVLNERERFLAQNLERQIRNSLGYEVSITTLTTIMKAITEQKFFEIAPADYLPVRVGEGAWSTNLLTYRSFQLSDDFTTGIINTGGNNSRLATGDAGVDSLTVKVMNWAKSIGWTIMDLEQAAKAGNWDLVTAKEQARKKNWDLGIQKVAFLGVEGNSEVLGLYNQAGIENNTSLLSGPISDLVSSPVNLSAFIRNLLEAYRANCNRTAWPTHLIIPESDYLGLATPSSPTYPIKSILQLMQETFSVMTGKPFKILPNAYGDADYNDLSANRYVLLNYDEQSLRMDIPVNYTNTLANSIDNFSFQNVGYGQFTGVLAYRPLELFYFGYSA